jgi:hypothetical protein
MLGQRGDVAAVLLQEAGGEEMVQRVRGNLAGDTRSPGCLGDDPLRGDRASRVRLL